MFTRQPPSVKFYVCNACFAENGIKLVYAMFDVDFSGNKFQNCFQFGVKFQGWARIAVISSANASRAILLFTQARSLLFAANSSDSKLLFVVLCLVIVHVVSLGPVSLSVGRDGSLFSWIMAQ